MSKQYLLPSQVIYSNNQWTSTEPPTIERVSEHSVNDKQCRQTPLWTRCQKPHEDEVRTMLSASLKDSIGVEIGAAAPEVAAVFAFVERNICHIWTVVTASVPEIRKRVYEREQSLIEKYADLEFDFNILASHGQDPKRVIVDPELELAYLRA